MFLLYADKTRLTVQEREPVTSGSVNAYRVRFDGSGDWDGLSRTAVFQAGSREVSVRLDASGECAVPWEVLTEPGRYLVAGMYGKRGEELILPTVWTCLGMVLEGAQSAPPSAPPAPELWEQELDQKGDTLGYTEEGRLGLYAGGRLLSSVPAGPAQALTNAELKEMLK